MEQQKGQQLFLQWLMSARICTLEDAEKSYCHIFELENSNRLEGFNSFFDSCAASLSLFGLKLQRQFVVTEREKREFVAICNTVSDKISQIATNFSSIEIKNFKLVIEEMKKSADGEVSFNSISNITSLSRSAASTYLNSLIDNEWIELNPDTNRYHLGLRSILELDEVLRQPSDQEDENGPSFSQCSLCFGLILIGSKCSCLNQSCNQTFHKLCLTTYQEIMRKQECPGCKTFLQLETNSVEPEHVDIVVNI